MARLDLTMWRCPMPLVQTKMYLKQNHNPLPLTLLVKDPASISDLPKYLLKQGYTVSTKQLDDCFEITINKQRNL